MMEAYHIVYRERRIGPSREFNIDIERTRLKKVYVPKDSSPIINLL
jgi:hypothetical protein